MTKLTSSDLVKKPAGYPTESGWMGRMPDKTWHLFATEKDYLDSFYAATPKES